MNTDNNEPVRKSHATSSWPGRGQSRVMPHNLVPAGASAHDDVSHAVSPCDAGPMRRWIQQAIDSAVVQLGVGNFDAEVCLRCPDAEKGKMNRRTPGIFPFPVLGFWGTTRTVARVRVRAARRAQRYVIPFAHRCRGRAPPMVRRTTRAACPWAGSLTSRLGNGAGPAPRCSRRSGTR